MGTLPEPPFSHVILVQFQHMFDDLDTAFTDKDELGILNVGVARTAGYSDLIYIEFSWYLIDILGPS